MSTKIPFKLSKTNRAHYQAILARRYGKPEGCDLIPLIHIALIEIIQWQEAEEYRGRHGQGGHLMDSKASVGFWGRIKGLCKLKY